MQRLIAWNALMWLSDRRDVVVVVVVGEAVVVVLLGYTGAVRFAVLGRNLADQRHLQNTMILTDDTTTTTTTATAKQTPTTRHGRTRSNTRRGAAV